MTLNIKEVTLYQSGVGFFSAESPEKEFVLPVNETDINDVLKSLSVNGLNSVRFSSAEEMQNIINKIGIDLETEGALLSICEHLIGTEVKITTDKIYIGTVIGIDEIDDATDEKNSSKEVLVLKVGKDIVNFPLTEIKNLDIIDSIIQKDVETYLSVVANKRKAGVINLQVNAEVNSWASWVMPVSSWRLSYRVFYKKEKKNLDLFGISIIDNTTSIDWENIILRLVTGKPVSFQYDLYNPLFITRPEIQRDVKGVAPIVSEAGGAFEDFDEEIAERSVEGVMAPPPPLSAKPPTPMAAEKARKSKAVMKGYAEPVPTTTMADIVPTIEAMKQEIGSAIAYLVNYPITINRSQSAMIPIFSEKIDADTCVILREDRLNEAMDALKFKEPLEVEKGAATIYFDGQFVGESMVIPGTEFIAFRLNQDISAIREVTSSSKIESIALEGQYLNIKSIYKMEYQFKLINRAKEPLNLILEISKPFNYTPIQKPDAETKQYYQYTIELKPGNSVKKITFESESFDFKYLSDLSESQIKDFFSKDLLSAVDERRIKNILDLMRQIKQKEYLLQEAKNEIEEHFRNQQRLRQNIIVTKDDKNMRDDYLSKLDESENRIKILKQSVANLKDEIEDLTHKLNKL